MSFEQFAIDPRCLGVLRRQQIATPTPVQAEAIPTALEGRDLTAIAQTGTGKTLAFGLPSVTRLAASKHGRNRMLVLTPTRELAQQVHNVLQEMGKALGLRTTAVYGGVGMEPQTKALRRGVDIVVACPGRLLDHMSRGNARFRDLSLLVLDEADRMLDMGFLPDIKRILAKLPAERQTLMFSATFPPEIEALARDFQQTPARIEVGQVATPVESVRQGVYTVTHQGKLDLLTKLLKEEEIASALVFLRTKYRTERVAKALEKAGFKAQAIHGGRTQGQRQRTIEGFRKGRFKILVATDVVARGLDIQGISHVVNYDIPTSPDDYIHRIGRTARACADGDAITFVCPEDHYALHSIERVLGKALPREDWEGAVPVKSGSPGGQKKKPAPKSAGAGTRSRKGAPEKRASRPPKKARQGGEEKGEFPSKKRAQTKEGPVAPGAPRGGARGEMKGSEKAEEFRTKRSPKRRKRATAPKGAAPGKGRNPAKATAARSEKKRPAKAKPSRRR